MTFGISPSSPTPPVTSDGFPDYNIQFQNSGTDLGAPADIDTVNFRKGVLATRGTGESTNVVSAEFDDSTAEYTPAGTGAVVRTVRDKLRESMSLADKGGDATGVASAVTPLTNLFAASIGLLVIGSGTYDIPTVVRPAVRDVQIVIDPTASFTGAGYLEFGDIIEWQIEPVFCQDAARKEYGTDYDDYNNIFLHARHVRNSTTGKPVVAYYGLAESNAANARAFGCNFSGFITADGGRAQAAEFDVGYRNGATTGSLNGVLIVSAGPAAPNSALQIQCNDATAEWGTGINFSFNADSDEPSGGFTGALVRAGSNASVPGSCERFIYATSDISFTSAEIDLPSFHVAATPANVVNRVSIQAGASGSPARVKAIGTDTNVVLNLQSQGTGVMTFTTNGVENFRVTATTGSDALQVTGGTGIAGLSVRGGSANADVAVDGKGTGGVQLRDGAAAVKVRVNTTGLGFYGATPVAQPASYGTPTNVSKIASLTGTAASLADVGGTLAALITDLKSQGLIAA